MRKMLKLFISIPLLLAVHMAFLPQAAFSADKTEKPFLPTWKLLSNQQKQQFIAGYIQGWIDAARVTDIAIGFIKENPSNAVESLERIKKLYDLSLMRPELLTREIDTFYSKSENSAASLSMAVTSAKMSLKNYMPEDSD